MSYHRDDNDDVCHSGSDMRKQDGPQHLHIPCKIPLDIILMPALSLLERGEGRYHLVGVMDKEDRLGGTVLRKCLLN